MLGGVAGFAVVNFLVVALKTNGLNQLAVQLEIAKFFVADQPLDFISEGMTLYGLIDEAVCFFASQDECKLATAAVPE